MTMPDVYEEIREERRRQISKGRDAVHDDARSRQAWLECLALVVNWKAAEVNWRCMWIKVAAVAVAAVEADDRKESVACGRCDTSQP